MSSILQSQMFNLEKILLLPESQVACAGNAALNIRRRQAKTAEQPGLNSSRKKGEARPLKLQTSSPAGDGPI